MNIVTNNSISFTFTKYPKSEEPSQPIKSLEGYTEIFNLYIGVPKKNRIPRKLKKQLKNEI